MLFALALLFVSCQGNEIKDIKDRLSTVSQEMSELQMAVAVQQLRFESETMKMAELDPTLQAYAVATTNNGPLLVSCEDIKPYGDGQKLTLTIGNPLNMTFNGFSLVVRYGARAPALSPDSTSTSAMLNWMNARKEWRNNLKEKKETYSDKLLPGSWNGISLTIAPCKAEELGYLAIEISTNNVGLKSN